MRHVRLTHTEGWHIWLPAGRLCWADHQEGKTQAWLAGDPYEMNPWTVQETADEIAALLSPPPPAPTRAIHPLALAYLQAERVNGPSGTTEEARRANLAYSDWREADCPIWADATP